MTEQTSRIIAANPKLVRYSFQAGQPNLRPRVHRVSKEAYIKLLAFTRIDYYNRDLNAVNAEIGVRMTPYVDDIFADKVTNIVTVLE